MTRPDPAMMDSRFARIEDDFYSTPAWCWAEAAKIMRVIDPGSKSAWECACGNGVGAETLKAHGFERVLATDLVDRGYGVAPVDFLRTTATTRYRYDWIATNPPYDQPLMNEFIAHAIEMAREHKCGVAMLVRKEWDAAGNRRHLLEQSGIYVGKLELTKRPRWFARKEDSKAPRHNYTWLFWHGEHGSAEAPWKVWYQKKN